MTEELFLQHSQQLLQYFTTEDWTQARVRQGVNISDKKDGKCLES